MSQTGDIEFDGSAFSPQESLAAFLLPHTGFDGGDGAHDVGHLQRVWRNASRIQAEEGGDAEILLAAVLLHDCVAVEKDSPRRSQASRLAAAHAASLLERQGWAQERIAAVVHAIEAHSFSAGIEPESLEAMILRDADRLDAIGMIGIARCFYIAGRLGHAIYDPQDPTARSRPYDDRFAADHFETKLLRLGEGFKTATGARMSEARLQRLRAFLDGLWDEIGAAP
ncbi:HD domain-containing protein [Consotaella aegiceratis]|uniref:HD domain-containing protein n=1 Tax=Consotaella aegiceratis TaxID=3097961 RepID=UPI002F3EDFC0